ncbi:hypothetical protein JAAARDRAFT_32626 [Jaapia argillacea MUCL 33604]|uniref:G-alpha-domain-containing protein n=1 Tax=Jaapia argillacea MUCL 33604 TaxID=933084 RepID=A0A067QCC9_9AGAM|nr:hypothetical protein JAAARDRAFT_32626 [Jaapia argillacea MUCL 33604]
MRNRRQSSQLDSGRGWPPDADGQESEADKTLRLDREKEAKRISDEIDKAIEAQREEMRKRKIYSKILLLGQAESGKSTVLKNFQMQFTPKAFKAESGAWRAVIHLNLVRSVNFILDLISSPSSSPTLASTSTAQPPSPTSSSPNHDQEEHPLPTIDPTPELRHVKMRLLPLRRVEAMLSKRISPDDPGQFVQRRTSPNGSGPGAAQAPDVSVRSGGGWKNFVRLQGRPSSSRSSNPDEVEDAGKVIEACREDIVALWQDKGVQNALKNQDIHMQEQSGFFLSEVDRIASTDYQPTPDDILRARLQTLGVEEHRLVIETGTETGREWIVYDVGGTKGQRPAWAPFFDDVNVLIFLAPISAFNQTLAEDRGVNRLWDSFFLWQSICSNKILANVTIVLMLNKFDLLEAKLAAGIPFNKYVTSYKESVNDVEHVSKYLKGKFSAIHRQHSNRTRKLHIHFTNATDHRATSIILSRIREQILEHNLMDSDFV